MLQINEQWKCEKQYSIRELIAIKYECEFGKYKLLGKVNEKNFFSIFE